MPTGTGTELADRAADLSVPVNDLLAMVEQSAGGQTLLTWEAAVLDLIVATRTLTRPQLARIACYAGALAADTIRTIQRHPDFDAGINLRVVTDRIQLRYGVGGEHLKVLAQLLSLHGILAAEPVIDTLAALPEAASALVIELVTERGVPLADAVTVADGIST